MHNLKAPTQPTHSLCGVQCLLRGSQQVLQVRQVLVLLRHVVHVTLAYKRAWRFAGGSGCERVLVMRAGGRHRRRLPC